MDISLIIPYVIDVEQAGQTRVMGARSFIRTGFSDRATRVPVGPGNRGESRRLTGRSTLPLTWLAAVQRVAYRDLPNWWSRMEQDVLIKCVAADIEATVPGAFDLPGPRAVVDVHAAAVKELGQGDGKAVHDRGHVPRVPCCKVGPGRPPGH